MDHHLAFHKMAPQDQSEGGYRIRATKGNFPILQNMSLYKLILHPKSVREPHWHANADELGYCLKGEILVSIYGNKNDRETFIVKGGGAFFIPSGALHSLENIGDGDCELIVEFSHEEPEDFGLSSVFNMFSNPVLGNTWNFEASHFNRLKRPIRESFITKLDESTPISKEMRYSSTHQFALEESAPLISNDSGLAKVARNNVWPILKRQALYSLKLTGEGMREPHWHPETAELGYVSEGKGRMSILSPSGKVDTYTMETGDIYFIPKAYPHHIENLQSSNLSILIFFDQSMPQDIGFTGSVKSFPDEVLAKIMCTDKDIFQELPTYYEDLFIVEKKNQIEA